MTEAQTSNERLTLGMLDRIRRDHVEGTVYAMYGQRDIGLLLGEIDRLSIVLQYPENGFARCTCGRNIPHPYSKATCAPDWRVRKPDPDAFQVPPVASYSPDETSKKPARDAEHCDFPDCEQHNSYLLKLAVDAMEHEHSGFGTRYQAGCPQCEALRVIRGAEETTAPPHPGPSIEKAFARSPRRVETSVKSAIARCISEGQEQDFADANAEKATALPDCECLVRDKTPSAYHNVKCPRYIEGAL